MADYYVSPDIVVRPDDWDAEADLLLAHGVSAAVPDSLVARRTLMAMDQHKRAHLEPDPIIRM